MLLVTDYTENPENMKKKKGGGGNRQTTKSRYIINGTIFYYLFFILCHYSGGPVVCFSVSDIAVCITVPTWLRPQRKLLRNTFSVKVEFQHFIGEKARTSQGDKGNQTRYLLHEGYCHLG